MTRGTLALVMVWALATPLAAEAQEPLPTKAGEVFVVDDFDAKVTPADLGTNAFAGNVGATETVAGTTSLSYSGESSGSTGGSLRVGFDFTGTPAGAFAGLFMSVFGLTDALVSLDGSGAEPPAPTAFPGSFLDTQDVFREARGFGDLGLEELRLDLRLETAQALRIKVELEDEDGHAVSRLVDLAPSGATWQPLRLALPGAFTTGETGAFDWRRVSVMALIVERTANPGIAGGTFLLDNIAFADTDGVYPDLGSPALIDGTTGSVRAEYRDSVLDHVRKLSLQYFLDFGSTDPRTGGIVQDRSAFADLMTVGGVGFQLSAYCIAAERGDLTRQEAAARVLRILRVLRNQPQGPARVGTAGHKGFFYHFLGIDGRRKQNFDVVATPGVNEALNTVELSAIDTALAVAGVVTASRYFDQGSEDEQEIVVLANQIYARVDWRFMVDAASGQAYLGWKPNETRDDDSGCCGRFVIPDAAGEGQYASKLVDGVEKPATIDFYTDEGLLFALLAMGSPDPTHRVGREVWDAMLRRDAPDGVFVRTFPGSLFTYTFGALWLDTRALGTDDHRTAPENPSRPVDFFDNTRQAALATRAYTMANPRNAATWREGRGASHWGLSAAEGPYDDYFAYAAPWAAIAGEGGRLASCAPGAIALEAEAGSGDGVLHFRSNASGGQAVWLHAGETRTIGFTSARPESFELIVRYSNDNFGALERVSITVDGTTVGAFDAQDTGGGGAGWNVFLTADATVPFPLATGAHQVQVTVSGGDGNGVEIDTVSLLPRRPLADGTVTVYGAGSALRHTPEAATTAIWGAVREGFLHPRFGAADAYNLDIADAALTRCDALRTSGRWANFTGFAIDHGPLVIGIDNALHAPPLVPTLFMSHPDIAGAWQSLFPEPVITGFSPGQGLRGATVVIRGAHFTGASRVAFGGADASFVVDSDSQITAVVPAAAVSGRVEVATPAGAGESSASFVVIRDADLAIVVSGPAFAVRGGTLSYSTTITNVGPAEAEGVEVNLGMPSGLLFVANGGDCTTGLPCTFASLAAGASRTFTTTVGVPVGFAPAPIEVVATVSASSPDPGPGNDAAIATTRFGTFFTVPPCRVADTRAGGSPNGPPALASGESRTLVLAGTCGVPAGATAVAVNVTVTSGTAAGNVRLFPSDAGGIPLVSTVNYVAGRTRANNAIVTGSADGSVGITVHNSSTGSVELILDVSGYFE